MQCIVHSILYIICVNCLWYIVDYVSRVICYIVYIKYRYIYRCNAMHTYPILQLLHSRNCIPCSLHFVPDTMRSILLIICQFLYRIQKNCYICNISRVYLMLFVIRYIVNKVYCVMYLVSYIYMRINVRCCIIHILYVSYVSCSLSLYIYIHYIQYVLYILP